MFKLSISFMVSAVLVLALITGCQQQQFDIIIQGGTIIDGTGSEGFVADIGITGDRIASIGNLSNAIAMQVVSAEGLVVSPGFIDVHSHSDRSILDIPSNDNFIFQGVTSIVSGNCGSSPLNIKEYFEELESKRPATNVAVLIGHNMVRRKVMQASSDAPSVEHLEEMKSLIDQAMSDGAIGMSTGLEYTPGMFSKTEELITLNKMVAKHGGIYASHIRDEEQGLHDAVKEAVRIGEEAGTRVQVSHLKISRDEFWGQTDILQKVFAEARNRGVEVYNDQYPYIAASTSLRIIFPKWSLADGKLFERLKDPATRKKIKNDLFKLDYLGPESKRDVLSIIRIANYAANQSYEGKTLKEILEMKNIVPTVANAAELAIEIQSNGGASCVLFLMSETDVGNIMNFPYTMIASDGSVRERGKGVPHPRSYGTFPRVLAKYVREDNILSLESAVNKMTALPAKAFRIEGRGTLAKGNFADIVIFDPEKVSDTATFADPHNYPEGIQWVFVNGVITVNNGELTQDRAGKPIYGPGKKAEN